MGMLEQKLMVFEGVHGGSSFGRRNVDGEMLLEFADALDFAIVNIDSMQFGFMAGKSTTDAIFIVRQLQEKYLARNKELWMAFVDLEKAFDRVPQVVWWALRCLGVDKWIVSVIKAMYEDATVRVNGRESKAFSVRVGVHQGSVLSPAVYHCIRGLV